MQLGNIKTIFSKELKDTLRDRRTMIFAFLLPIIMMPVIMTGIMKLQMSAVSKIEAQKSTVVIKGFALLPRDLQDTLRADSGLVVSTEADHAGEDLVSRLKQKKYQAVMMVSDNFSKAIELESSTDLEIYYDRAEELSASAYDKLTDILDRYKDRLIQSRITQRNISDEILKPFQVIKNNVASAQKLAGKGLGSIIPYFIILTCFLGAMTPAVDLGAGEKERGTIETLLVAPASRGEFVLGKYFVIMLTSVTAGLLSLASMTLFFKRLAGDSQMKRLAEVANIQFDFQTVLLVLMVVIPLAGIFSAIMLSISIFAKSAKEAQGYIGFLQFAMVLPAFVSLVPGVDLNLQMALIPVVNISLIIKNAIAGTLETKYLLVAFASTIVVASAALYFAKKWFEREEVLFRM